MFLTVLYGTCYTTVISNSAYQFLSFLDHRLLQNPCQVDETFRTLYIRLLLLTVHLFLFFISSWLRISSSWQHHVCIRRRLSCRNISYLLVLPCDLGEVEWSRQLGGATLSREFVEIVNFFTRKFSYLSRQYLGVSYTPRPKIKGIFV